MSAPAFIIERIVASQTAGFVDVHVNYQGGGAIFTFPATTPKSMVLSQVRLEIKQRLAAEANSMSLASLVGRHDL